jgi:hypothetical protein
MEQNISFRIEGIELLEYAIIAPDQIIEPQAVFKFDINIEHRFNLENNNVFVIVAIHIFLQETGIKVGNAKISCIYKVERLQNYVDNTNQVSFPQDFIISLNSISLSTCRGVIFALFRGTFLHNAILPIVDPKSFQIATPSK